MSQEYIVVNIPQPNHPIVEHHQTDNPRPWYENKELITNDNIFDINDLEKIIIQHEQDSLPIDEIQ